MQFKNKEIERIKENFLNNVKEHDLKVIRDDGLFRYLRFKAKSTKNYWFDLITWNGVLCINGDCGTFVFSRIDDMFQFFRNPNEKLEINEDYWHEKLLAFDKGGSERFSIDVAKNIVEEEIIEYYSNKIEEVENEDEKKLLIEKREECLKEAKEDIFIYDEKESFCRAVDDFIFDEFHINSFCWEYNLNEYTFNFIFCLFAIVWGIKRYDDYKENLLEKIN